MLKQRIKSLQPRLDTIFRHLHENGELSWEETATTRYIKKIFQDEDCKIIEFDGMTGLVIEIGSGEPVIAVRADIDALWQEVDGVFQANHSCGHDAHMTIVIGAIFTLLAQKEELTCRYRFIFQPAEEKGEGALAVVGTGVMDDVDYLYGLHLRPAVELADGKFAPAIQHGAACLIRGQISGEDAHGARPHLNVNAIEVGSTIVQQLNQIHLDPALAYSVKLTAFEAGGKSANIIPGSARFALDLRAQTNETMDILKARVNQIMNSLMASQEIEIETKIEANIAAAILEKDAIQIMSAAIEKVVGSENNLPPIITTGGDDFHFYTIKRPQIKATMLAIGCGLTPGLHHAQMTFNQAIIPVAIEVLVEALLTTSLKEGS